MLKRRGVTTISMEQSNSRPNKEANQNQSALDTPKIPEETDPRHQKSDKSFSSLRAIEGCRPCGFQDPHRLCAM